MQNVATAPQATLPFVSRWSRAASQAPLSLEIGDRAFTPRKASIHSMGQGATQAFVESAIKNTGGMSVAVRDDNGAFHVLSSYTLWGKFQYERELPEVGQKLVLKDAKGPVLTGTVVALKASPAMGELALRTGAVLVAAGAEIFGPIMEAMDHGGGVGKMLGLALTMPIAFWPATLLFSSVIFDWGPQAEKPDASALRAGAAASYDVTIAKKSTV